MYGPFTSREKFERHVLRRKGCWGWKACKTSFGYGIIRINGKTSRAHRLSWEIYKGPIPEGLCVLHRCDNPECSNPRHLFLGTRKDNSDDRGRKGRTKFGYTSGSKCKTSKILESDSIRARKLKEKGLSYYQIAKIIGLGYAQTRRIVLGLSWKHTLPKYRN